MINTTGTTKGKKVKIYCSWGSKAYYGISTGRNYLNSNDREVTEITPVDKPFKFEEVEVFREHENTKVNGALRNVRVYQHGVLTDYTISSNGN